MLGDDEMGEKTAALTKAPVKVGITNSGFSRLLFLLESSRVISRLHPVFACPSPTFSTSCFTATLFISARRIRETSRQRNFASSLLVDQNVGDLGAHVTRCA